MATFKAVIQQEREDNTFLVYIRVTHNRKILNIKTPYYVHKRKVKVDSKGKTEINDQTVLIKCAKIIDGYMDKLRQTDCEKWTVKEVKTYLEGEKLSFYEFWEKIYMPEMASNDMDKSIGSYKSAVSSFRNFFGDDVEFKDITKKKIEEWIKSLLKYKRAKESYPVAIRKIFKEAVNYYNDYDANIIKIENQPFKGVKIPASDKPKERAIEAWKIRAICEFTPYSERTERAVDCAKLFVYFVGINSIDIFKRKKSEVVDGKLCYKRSKTTKRRTDDAYIEIAVRPEIQHLMTKYNNGDRLWDFGYADDKTFNHYINKALKKICRDLGIEEVDTYTFRHSWATIANTECGISEEITGFCLNHQSKFKTTAGYIKKKFAIIDETNDVVLDYIFNSVPEGKERLPDDAKVNYMAEAIPQFINMSYLELKKIADHFTEVWDKRKIDSDGKAIFKSSLFRSLPNDKLCAYMYVCWKFALPDFLKVSKWKWDLEFETAMKFVETTKM